MSLIRETNFTKSEFTLKKLAESWGLSFEEVAVDTEGTNTAEGGKLYLDKGTDIFIYGEKITYANENITLNFWLCYGAEIKREINVGVSYPQNLSVDRNPSGSVLYLLRTSGNSIDGMIAAKDKGDDWAVFSGNYIITKDGDFNITDPNVTINSELLYSAFPVPNAYTGKMFDGLYKLYTAPLFTVSGTYINFEGKPFRAVGMRSRPSPSYAFEARQE